MRNLLQIGNLFESLRVFEALYEIQNDIYPKCTLDENIKIDENRIVGITEGNVESGCNAGAHKEEKHNHIK